MAIDLATASMASVIDAAFALHRPFIMDRIHDVINTHLRFAANSENRLAIRIAANMASTLANALEQMEADSFKAAGLSFAAQIQLFHIACELMNIPRQARAAIAARSNAYG